MKVKVSETNMPKWGNVTVKFDVPDKLEALQEMSKNIFGLGLQKQQIYLKI